MNSKTKNIEKTLLTNVQNLVKPAYHTLNKHAGRNDRLLHAILCAYAKHHLNHPDIGWEQLGDILHNAICNEIGDKAYLRWVEMTQESNEL